MSASALPAAGRAVAGYTIEGVLGRGGMAVVYRATHPARGEPVALKLVAPHVRWEDDVHERFAREARLAAAVEHRGILPVYETGRHEGRPFVAMKLERSDLGRLLREDGRLTPARAVALVSQIAAALDAAHAHALVHRDVKPSNVLLGEEEGEERAYVADFGVARAAFSGVDLPTGELVGTIAYASPEQLRGEPVDHRSDVYSLGCLLYECLTGRLPYARRDSLAIAWAHLQDEPPRPSEQVPAVARGLDDVVRRALAKQPESRFGSAGELAATARAAVDGPSRRHRRANPVPSAFPAGTVTLLVAEGMDEDARRTVYAACSAQGGIVVEAKQSSLLAGFAEAEGALQAVAALPAGVRIGIHTGTPHATSAGYVGSDVRRAEGIAAAAHGGQVVVSSSTADVVDADRLRPLGLHRLEDFPEPVVLYQLGEGSFPPLKTAANTNLPVPRTSFVGREQDLREADLLLQETRLLSVTGPGGAGKTRFALELARQAREELFAEYQDGVFVCFLASLRDPALVLATVAQALSVPEQPGASALEALTAQVGRKRMLLVLDNAEHLLPALAEDLSQLLGGCPALTLLVTTRERLRVPDEHAYELPPLAADESVALFCERAACEPSEPIAELCSRLESLPLAIELAAARMSVLSPERLLERLAGRLDLLKAGRDADPRQQTLRATIEWSHDLLAPEAQRLFARLSVFAGGCALEAAEAVCAADLDSLESLLDKSLLRRSGDRFWMLETIREFAAELLERSEESDALARRHAEHFTELAEQIGPDARGRTLTVLDELTREYPNFRAALQWTEASGEFDLLARLSGALGMYWYSRGPYAEARRWLEAALTHQDSIDDARVVASIARGLGAVSNRQGDYALARASAEYGLGLARSVGDRHLECSCLYGLCQADRHVDDRVAAREHLVECLELAREVGDEITFARGMNLRGLINLEDGRLTEAASALRQSVTIADRLGEIETAMIATANFGLVELQTGRTRSAAARFRESLRAAEEMGHAYLQAQFVGYLALVADRDGDPRRAAVLFGVGSVLLEAGGGALDPYAIVLEEETRAAVWEQLGEEAAAGAFAAGAALGQDEALAYALAEPN
ncbi:MAG: protein kinase domain-containing protein [Gaiellaceae bacterium]